MSPSSLGTLETVLKCQYVYYEHFKNVDNTLARVANTWFAVMVLTLRKQTQSSRTAVARGDWRVSVDKITIPTAPDHYLSSTDEGKKEVQMCRASRT